MPVGLIQPRRSQGFVLFGDRRKDPLLPDVAENIGVHAGVLGPKQRIPRHKDPSLLPDVAALEARDTTGVAGHPMAAAPRRIRLAILLSAPNQVELPSRRRAFLVPLLLRAPARHLLRPGRAR